MWGGDRCPDVSTGCLRVQRWLGWFSVWLINHSNCGLCRLPLPSPCCVLLRHLLQRLLPQPQGFPEPLCSTLPGPKAPTSEESPDPGLPGGQTSHSVSSAGGGPALLPGTLGNVRGHTGRHPRMRAAAPCVQGWRPGPLSALQCPGPTPQQRAACPRVSPAPRTAIPSSLRHD